MDHLDTLPPTQGLDVPPSPSPVSARETLQACIARVNALILGKPQQVTLAFACLLVGGHLLIEDRPGTGKTMLARALASVLGVDTRRVQFTSDLMPSDILGVSIYQPQRQVFELRKGPIFTQVLLADEINRASPRTQSALLEAMAEGQVSIDGTTLPLPQPFLVLATQNPLDMTGTFPLPTAQRDRFLFQMSLGYPDRATELALMRGERRQDMIETRGGPVLGVESLMALRRQVRQVTVKDVLSEYMHDLVTATRNDKDFKEGLSPRASLMLMAATQALAFLHGRSYATPEDVQEAFLPVAMHRVTATTGGAEHLRSLLDRVLAVITAP